MTSKAARKKKRALKRKQKRQELLKSEEAQELAEDPEADIQADEESEEETEEIMEEILEEEVDEFTEEELAALEDMDEEELLAAVEEMEVEEETEASEEKSYFSDIFDEVDFDFEMAEIKALDLMAEPLTINERATLLKAKLTSATRTALPDTAFACIRNGQRHFPIHDKAHVRNALARLPQARPEIAACARSKVLAAAKRMGIGQPGKKDNSHFIIEKDANGDLRWIGYASNRWVDLEEDILTDAAHKEFSEFLSKSKFRPPFLAWHRKEAKFTHPVDAWMYKNGFMVYSGKLEEHEAERLLRIAQKEKLGMSHGFIALERDAHNQKHITKYRTFEVSVLPRHNAANPFTGLDVVAKEANFMDATKFLRELLGDEAYSELEKDTKKMEDLLDTAGVESKEKEEQTEEITSDVEAIIEELNMPALSKAFEQMQSDVEALKEDNQEGKKKSAIMFKLIEALLEDKEDADVTLAKMIEGKNRPMWAWERATESKENMIDEEDDEDKELLKSFPSIDGLDEDEFWLSKITGARPLPEKDVEKLQEQW